MISLPRSIAFAAAAALTSSPLAALAEDAPAPVAAYAKVPVRLNGIVHAMALVTQGVQSFGQPNASAPTAAVNPLLVQGPGDPELTFQVQQTRLGLIAGEGTPIRGTVEVDFIHFDQSSPTTQAFPRVRMAFLDWEYARGQRLFFGQTWDIFGNAKGPQLLSHSVNLVGTMFQAGNIGFMRHQLGWSGRFGDIELATALGLQGANFGPAFGPIERGATPTGSMRAMLHLGNAGVIGVSGLGSALRFEKDGDAERRLALGGEVFSDVTFGPVNLHAEAYVAQNLANMGALNLGQGRFGQSVSDVGGYASARVNLGRHAFTAMMGGAGVLNPAAVAPGYAAAVVDAMTQKVTTPAAATPAAGPGITRNASVHLGYGYSPLPGLSLVLEPYVYATRFVFQHADVGRASPDRLAWGTTIASMFQF